ncbi:MAG TPA: hypothetical protein VFE17_03340 [Candidatus Baltobacteraceae bacterium]|nr:hypothetical protein [Candidatus Baltobacteraceae bacterium]
MILPAAILAAISLSPIPVPMGTPPLQPSAPPGAWTSPPAPLDWDILHREASQERTVAHIATDGHFLYVRFDAQQRESIAAAQHSNDVGQGNDDSVWIDLWPNGLHGFYYQFQATPNGTHYETSSENTSYSPNWDSFGRVDGQTYTVTMKIPLDAIRGMHPGVWTVQFARYVHATGSQYVWNYDSAQTSPDDEARAGRMLMPQGLTAGASRPKPRLAIYALGQAVSAPYGGNTSRMGADLSVPITPTASFYSTFHPDYSNVELDQQSISPTVYQRYFSEVRPFFTQAANFYNNFNCDACPNIQMLYTPAIPTPRQGYAVEGKQGLFSFASFDSLGDERTDIASVLDYHSPDTKWQGTVQRVQANLPGLTDTSIGAGIAYYDLKHTSFYVNSGYDSGTNVLDASQSQWYDVGGGWSSKTFGLFGSMRKVGQYFNPVDGFISHPGIAGYALYAAKIFDFSPRSVLASAGVAGFVDRYQGPTQGYAQTDNSLTFDFLTKSALDLQLFSGSDYWRFDQTLEPISQNAGIVFTYHSGLQTNNPGQFPNHGSSATPTQIQYFTGRYGTGRLDTWFRNSTIRAGTRGLLTLAIDNTAQWMPRGSSNIQWFDSLSYAYQISANSSVALGVRKVVGYPPIPNGGGNCEGTCTNLSLAYHLRLRSSEIYFAYGNPNTLTTIPQLLLKIIFYEGAQKGT